MVLLKPLTPKERKERSRQALEARGGREIRVALNNQAATALRMLRQGYKTDAEAINALLTQWLAEFSLINVDIPINERRVFHFNVPKLREST